jgi:hypothetical protein
MALCRRSVPASAPMNCFFLHPQRFQTHPAPSPSSLSGPRMLPTVCPSPSVLHRIHDGFVQVQRYSGCTAKTRGCHALGASKQTHTHASTVRASSPGCAALRHPLPSSLFVPSWRIHARSLLAQSGRACLIVRTLSVNVGPSLCTVSALNKTPGLN